MAKKSGIGNIILIGGLALGGYLLYKMLSGNQTGAGGTSGYSSGWIPGDATPGTPMNGDSNLPGDVTPKVIIQDGDITVQPIPAVNPRPNIIYNLPAGNTITVPAPLGVTAETVLSPKATGFTAGTYGQAGQPSIPFLVNTVTRPTAPAIVRGTSTPAPTPIAAIAAGAPPRVVAKINAGSWY